MTISHNNTTGQYHASQRKENHFYKEYLVINPATMRQVIACRMYGTDRMNYCCIWVMLPSHHIQGSGAAGGYGYHKESAAAGDAIRKAGYKLGKDISGVGTTAVEEALLSIADFHGFTDCKIFTAHS